MRAVQVKAYVNPAELSVTSVPDAKQNPGEYLIEVKAYAANFFDTLQICGKYQWQPPPPWIGGSEFSGIIIATPSPSSKFNKGDKIFGSSQGASGDLISVKEENLQPIPEGWSFRDAAALYLTGPTSYAALVIRANTQPGDWALIHGAAGGVGLGAVQVAKAFGAKVTTTATSERNIAVLKCFGADYIIDYKNVSVAGLHWGLYATEQPETVAKVWEGLLELVRKLMFRSSVYESEHEKRYKGLEDVPRAIKLSEGKASWGKVVIELDNNQARL